MLSQGTQLSGAAVSLIGGMAPGLPLATAQAGQARLLMRGQVFSAFGNWLGEDQTLELMCEPGTLNAGQIVGPVAKNGIQWIWMPGQTLATAISNALTQAFPGFDVVGSGNDDPTISSNLTLPNNYPQKGGFGGLAEFSSYIKQMTTDLGATFTNENTAAYYGVNIINQGNQFIVTDGTFTQTPTNLNAWDFCGQPTWLNGSLISFKMILRGDVNIGDKVMFPSNVIAPYATITQGAAATSAPLRSKSIFQNAFEINSVHHYANFRQADAESWNTTFTAIAPVTQQDLTKPSFYSLVNGSG